LNSTVFYHARATLVTLTLDLIYNQTVSTEVISSLDLQIVTAVEFGRQEQHEKYPELNICHV
jgi:hypothetical protein